MNDAFFACDSTALTGPSIVNKYYKKYLGSRYRFAVSGVSLPHRILDGLTGILTSRVVVFSGLSKADSLYLFFAKLFHRKTMYIMHGCVAYEDAINRVEHNEGDVRIENDHLKRVDRILCVSEQFTRWTKARYPEYADKIGTLINGVDWDITLPEQQGLSRRAAYISTIGGGVPRKNVISICKAVQALSEETGREYTLKVFGRDDLDTEAVKRFPFVRYYGKIPREDLFRELSETTLFVQNSVFDSFAMAPLEALMDGCSILCSANVGALSVMNGLQDSDIVSDCYDVDELKTKIRYLLEHPNHDRLYSCLDRQTTGFEARAGELSDQIQALIKGR